MNVFDNCSFLLDEYTSGAVQRDYHRFEWRRFVKILNKYSKRSNQLAEVSDIEGVRSVLIAKVRQFSDESVHRTGEVGYDYFESFGPRHKLLLCLYANGFNDESKGYVSLRIRVSTPLSSVYEYLELCCIVSVIDSSGNERFLRSFTFPYFPEWGTRTESKMFDINQYIKRETLLGETLDLLPKGCLSLHIDVTLKESEYASRVSVKDKYLTVEIRGNVAKWCLSLNNELAERLKEESTYFQRMSESAMEEKRRGYMYIPSEEYKPFRFICELVLGSEYINVESIHDICLMYILADKYHIPVAIETCRRLLITFLRVKNDETIVQHVDESIPEMLQLAERFNDVRLKEIIESIENGDRTPEDEQDNLETEWGVGFLETRIVQENSLLFHLWKYGKVDQDKSQFEFYQ